MKMSVAEQTISDPFCNQPKEKNCSNCSVTFSCGPIAGKGSCWCEELPHVSLVAGADQDCLCRECLREAIAKLNNMDSHRSTSPDGIVRTMPALVEGQDYYCEGSAIVFTASYLLRRGNCCESSCRHCPYETAQVNKQTISTPLTIDN
jgi:hypothetical protein